MNRFIKFTAVLIVVLATLYSSFGTPLNSTTSGPSSLRLAESGPYLDPVSTKLLVQHTYDSVLALAEMRIELGSKLEMLLDKITTADERITDLVNDQVETLIAGEGELKNEIGRVRDEVKRDVETVRQEIRNKFNQASRDRDQIRSALGRKEIKG